MDNDDTIDLFMETVPKTEQEEATKIYRQEGMVACVLFMWTRIWGPSQRNKAKKAIESKDFDSIYYTILFQKFDIKKHFEIVDSHREWVMKSYERLQKYVPHMTVRDAKNHDLSKYSIEQSIGYTAKLVHGVEGSNNVWVESHMDHYQKETHHPEHFPGKSPMPKDALDESLVDMVACRWERDLDKDESLTNNKLVDFDPKYLLRYCDEDRGYIEDLIKQIKLE